jgi:S1-C subfamily serine protease
LPTDRFAARLIMVAAAAVVVALAWQGGQALRDRLAPPATTPVVAPAQGRDPGEARTIALFEAARESVVFITTQREVLDPWRRVRREQPQGTGSGFLWDDAGHVVTNAHVIAGASSASVRLADGTVAEARLVGADTSHDLAVLRIDADDLAALPRGRSADLQVGQDVLAIGNPFGLDWTLTTGIVSALDRQLPAERGPGLRGLIQTDAAINPGNSGGPLLDSSGRLIGVNTAIYSPSGSSAGIGFAVPVDTVARVVPQLIQTGRYQPPRIGIEVDARVNALARRQGLEGVLILGVEPGSPAAEAGLEPARISARGIRPGDVLTAIDGRRIVTVEDMVAELDRRRAGETVTLTLRRDGRSITREVELIPGGAG